MNPITRNDYQPTGTGILTQNELYMEGGPEFWFGGAVQYDSTTGFYWGLQATNALPVYKIGCYVDFRLRDNVTTADIRCDTDGMRAAIQKRNFLDVSFNCMSLFPLSIFHKLVVRSGDGVALTNPTYLADPTNTAEYMGWGMIDNNLFFPCYFSKVYDATSGDFLSFTGHRCQFVDMTEIAFSYGQPYVYRVSMRLYADGSKPTGQRFATVVRYDPSMLA